MEGYWVVRTYESGIIGEKTKFWIRGSRPSKACRKEKSDIKKQEQNEYAAVKALARLMHANFRKGDLLLGLDYSDEGLSRLEDAARKKNMDYDQADEEQRRDYLWAQAKHEAALCVRRVNRELAKAGLKSVKCITITSDMDGDTGEQVRVHHHMIVPAGTEEFFRQKWGKIGTAQRETSMGGVAWSAVSKQADWTPIAEYFLRQVRQIPDANKYSTSRNLIRPQPKDRVAISDAELRVPKGGKLLFRQEQRIHEDCAGQLHMQPQYIRYIIPADRRKERMSNE